MTTAMEVAASLRSRGMTLALAESMTGGLVTSRLTDVPGASDFLLLGVVAYSDASKRDILGVREITLRDHGAVSAEVAVEMAERARLLANADLGASCTGIAGPTGATMDNPLGTAFLACVGRGYERMERMRFEGGRLQVKESVCEHLLLMIMEAVEFHGGGGRSKGSGE